MYLKIGVTQLTLHILSNQESSMTSLSEEQKLQVTQFY